MIKIFCIELMLDNAAFDDGNNGMLEVRRILQGVVDAVDLSERPLRDINGDVVGAITLQNI